MKFVFDEELCTSCGACAIACMDQNDTDISAGRPPLRKIFSDEHKIGENVEYRYFTTSCMHCSSAPCISACPKGCLWKDELTNFIISDNNNCIGCKSCEEVCPYNAPVFDSEGKMHKCDGCIVRVKSGMEPACTRVCPTGALRFYRK